MYAYTNAIINGNSKDTSTKSSLHYKMQYYIEVMKK